MKKDCALREFINLFILTLYTYIKVFYMAVDFCIFQMPTVFVAQA
jgi:hypothetical protein